TAWSLIFAKDFPPLCHRLRAGVKNILYLFNECSSQTPLSGWKSMLSRYLQSNGILNNKNSIRKGFKMRDYLLFYFFKFINLKFFNYEQKVFKCDPVWSLDDGFYGHFCLL
ncbi:hypothetical protein, partial [Bacteroides thetaiotaomicron]